MVATSFSEIKLLELVTLSSGPGRDYLLPVQYRETNNNCILAAAQYEILFCVIYLWKFLPYVTRWRLPRLLAQLDQELRSNQLVALQLIFGQFWSRELMFFSADIWVNVNCKKSTAKNR